MMRCTFLFVGAAAFLGCGELPAPERPDPDEFAVPENPTTPDPGVGVGEGRPPVVPLLDSMPAETGFLIVPLSGVTGPLAAVVVEGGAGTGFTDADSTGRFCIDVALRAEETQTLSVYAQDEQGRASESTEVVITHDPSMSPEPVELTPEELIESVVEAGVTQVYADAIPDGGSLAHLVDNDPSTILEIGVSRLAIDLGARFDLTEIEVVFPDRFGEGNDEYATRYVVSTSELDQSSVPTAWTAYRTVDGIGGGLGDGGSDLFTVEPTVSARWIALELQENAKSFDLFEPFRIADVRARARFIEVPEPDPQPQAPRCAESL